MPKNPKTKAVAKVEKPTNDPVALMSSQDLQAQISSETTKRGLIRDFIAKHLSKSVDFGPIHVAKNCPNKYNCTNKYHFSKDVLFKPGAEKFCSLFKLRAEFKKDTDTWEMLGSKSGEIAYLCQLYTVGGDLVGEGRGVASVSEKGNANTAVKIAEKRAKLDAVLSTGALSDFFTQDLEDMQPTEPETDDMPSIEVEPGEQMAWPDPGAPVKVVPKKEVPDKVKIFHLSKLLGIDPVLAPEEISKITSLEFTEDNYPEIVNRLEITVNERKQ